MPIFKLPKVNNTYSFNRVLNLGGVGRMLLTLMLACPVAAHAQGIAPSQVTPRVIEPAAPQKPAPALPQPEKTTPDTAIDPALVVDAGGVTIEGGFPQMAGANDRFVARVANRKISLSALLEEVRQLEQDYARQGFILARVTLPPQRIEAGSNVRVLVVDGFVEAIDTSALAASFRPLVDARLRGLIGRTHLTQAQLERALLIAGDLPGVALRSALAPGAAAGGVKLIIDGDMDRFEAQIGLDNGLPETLGDWQLVGSAAFNGPLGRGDKAYVTLGSEAYLGRYGFPKATLGLFGSGYVLPMGDTGTTLTGEFLYSRTQPKTQSGLPQYVGSYKRGMLRLAVPVVRTRQENVTLTASGEIIHQSQNLPEFDTLLSQDRYVVIRAGAAWQRDLAPFPFSANLTLSQGLKGRKATATLPLSRQGADTNFTALEFVGHSSLRLQEQAALDVTLRAATSFGRSVYLSEQFALDAANGVSTYESGSFSVDSGITLRTELKAPAFRVSENMAIAPYLFAANGWGEIIKPTAVELGEITAGSFGLGARVNVLTFPKASKSSLSLGIEIGEQFSNVPGRKEGRRVSVNAAVRF